MGLIRFKNGWGAKKEIIDYYRFNLVTKSEKVTKENFPEFQFLKKASAITSASWKVSIQPFRVNDEL